MIKPDIDRLEFNIENKNSSKSKSRSSSSHKKEVIINDQNSPFIDISESSEESSIRNQTSGNKSSSSKSSSDYKY